MATQVEGLQKSGTLDDPLSDQSKDRPAQEKEKKGWMGAAITWFKPHFHENGTLHRVDMPVFHLLVFFMVFSGVLYGLNHYATTMRTMRTEIKETLVKKGYALKDPLFARHYEEVEKTILISRLRGMLTMAQSLPDKLEKKDELILITSYLDHIKNNNLPFNSREAIIWLARQYR